MLKKTLIVERRTRHLWIRINGMRTSVRWDIDGVEKAGDCGYYRVMQNRRQVGIEWDVNEVKEEW